MSFDGMVSSIINRFIIIIYYNKKLKKYYCYKIHKFKLFLCHDDAYFRSFVFRTLGNHFRHHSPQQPRHSFSGILRDDRCRYY